MWKVRWNVQKSEHFQGFATPRSHSKTVGRGFESSRPCQEKSLTQSRWAFFNEICPLGKWNSFAVKYLLRKCEIFADANVGKFHFTSTEGRYFTIHEVNYFTFGKAEYFTFLFGAIPWHYFRTVQHQKSIKNSRRFHHATFLYWFISVTLSKYDKT